MTTPRTPTAVDAAADRYTDELFAADPLLATELGVLDHDDRVTDLSPEGVDERAGLTRRALAGLDALEPVDDNDRVTLAAMRERLGLELEVHDAGLAYAPLNVIASPVQGVREVFDVMATTTADDWATVARRMAAVPDALAGYAEGLRRTVAAGEAPSRRQVEAVARECDGLADTDDGFWVRLASGARPDGHEAPDALAADLRRGALASAEAYGRLAQVLREEVLPAAPAADASGRERYGLWSRSFLGATVDLDETYAWGLEELRRIEDEMAEVAERIVPGGSVDDAVAALDADPARNVEGGPAFRDWMQDLSDRAVASLADVHFDVPEPVRRLECCLAPTSSGGVYYSGPSEDFSRPGRMWWSVPEGVTTFSTWRETTTVYHEGVPGHHLQVGQTMVRAESLNRFRRLLCWVSGHGEGWALYAERLMADLGYLDDPGDRLGMLDGSALRALRVVVDIGLHCGLPAPAEVGGGTWDADKVWAFMRAHSRMDESFLRFEHTRYLGWPGQAPSYKVGERLWLQAREEVRRQQGEAFDLKDFHRRALDLGSLGLDVLREALVGGGRADR
ncbi:DUF885 domain-containing protein [Angustibacter speluncae]